MIERDSLLSANIGMSIIGIIILIVMCLLIYSLLQNTFVMRQIRNDLLSSVDENENKFDIEKAEAMFESGKIAELSCYCEQFIKEMPNNVHVSWYYALAHYNNEDYDIAIEYFKKVIRINPLWRDGATIYLSEISKRINDKNPQQKTLH